MFWNRAMAACFKTGLLPSFVSWRGGRPRKWWKYRHLVTIQMTESVGRRVSCELQDHYIFWLILSNLHLGHCAWRQASDRMTLFYYVVGLGSTRLSRCAVVTRFLLTILKEFDGSASFWIADKRHVSQILCLLHVEFFKVTKLMGQTSDKIMLLQRGIWNFERWSYVALHIPSRRLAL